MGLITKIFGKSERSGAAPAPHSEFRTSEAAVDQAKSRSNPRRELVQVVLRSTMRKHSIPSDWIDCRILSVLTRQRQSGVHVQFLVNKGDEQLLPYVHAFQESFRADIERFDPQAKQWLFSLAWQFTGKATGKLSALPTAASLDEEGDTEPRDAGDTLPPDEDADHLADDLQALQALMSQPAELVNLPAAHAGPHEGAKRP